MCKWLEYMGTSRNNSCRMAKVSISSDKYTYYCNDLKDSTEGIDVHDISVKTGKGGILLLFLSILVVLSITYLLLAKEKLNSFIHWVILLGTFFVVSLKLKQVKKESVVIMPAFGVQLETFYWSGRVTRRFVSVGMILKPVLNECVTPVTCYWSLALILRGEDQLMLVFQESRLPVQILIPVWKALCALLDSSENSKPISDESGITF